MAFFVSASTANADTVALPTHQIGDTLFVSYYRGGGTLSISGFPSDWNVQLTSFSSGGLVSACKIAETASETVPSLTDAQQCIAAVFRGPTYLQPWRNGNVASATSSTGAIAGLNVGTGIATQFCVGTIGVNDGTITLPSSTTNYTLVAEIQNGATGRVALYELNTPTIGVVASENLTLAAVGAWRSLCTMVLVTKHLVSSSGGPAGFTGIRGISRRLGT
jgi:hypothetical protein